MIMYHQLHSYLATQQHSHLFSEHEPCLCGLLDQFVGRYHSAENSSFVPCLPVLCRLHYNLYSLIFQSLPRFISLDNRGTQFVLLSVSWYKIDGPIYRLPVPTLLHLVQVTIASAHQHINVGQPVHCSLSISLVYLHQSRIPVPSSPSQTVLVLSLTSQSQIPNMILKNHGRIIFRFPFRSFMRFSH